MKKVIGLLFIFTFVLVGCSKSTVDEPCAQYESVIGVVTDSGGIADKSFNQGTWEGVEKYCADYQKGASYIQSVDETEFVANLTEMAEKNKVVVAVGFLMQEAVYEVAKLYPDVQFILIDGEPVNPATGAVEQLPNVTSHLFKEEEAGYLVGYIAGKTTKTNKIGYIGGQAVPPVQKFGWGYAAGASAANPDVEVTYQYADSFSDTALGKSMANAMYDSGCDIIFAAAGGVGVGAIEAAKDRAIQGQEVWIIGVDRDQYADGVYEDPNGTPNDGDEKSVILTSAVKRVEVASYESLVAFFNGTLQPGTQILGVAENGVGIPEKNPNVSPEVLAEAEEVSAKIADGSIVAPDTIEEAKAATSEITVIGEM